MKLCIGLLTLVTMATAAAAQTTRPAKTPPWPATIERFAQALLDGKAQALAAECDPKVAIRSLRGETQSIDRLLAVVSGGQLLGAHAYLYPPLTMGADVATDFKNAKTVPDKIKQSMIPVDDDAMKRANATAVQWVAQMLDVKQDDPVGVIIFWCPNRDDKNLLGAAAAPEVIFILLKAQPSAQDQFPIVLAEYGNPLASKN